MALADAWGQRARMPLRLLRALLAEKDAWEIVSFEDEAKAPRGLAELAPGQRAAGLTVRQGTII